MTDAVSQTIIDLDMGQLAVLDGMRGQEGSQAAFAGVPDPARSRFVADCGWYGPDADAHEGFFCLVQTGSAMVDLIGDVVIVTYGLLTVSAYCLGRASLPGGLSLSRPAWLRLAPLNVATVPVLAQAVLRADE